MKSAKKRSFTSLVVLFSLIFTVLSPINALADDATPPATEAPVTQVTEVPGTEVPVTDIPATPLPATEEPAMTEVPVTALPATEAPPTDTAEDGTIVPGNEDGIVVQEVVREAAANGIVLADSAGNLLVLGSVEAADAIVEGDPWYVFGGQEYHFTTLDCDPFLAGPQPCDNPIQAALDKAKTYPPDQIVADDGVLRRTIYVDPDTVWKDMHLNVTTKDVTLWGDPGILDGPGASPHAPVFDGQDKTGTAVTINAEGFTLIGFIIQNYDIAIHQPVISGSNAVNILNNTIKDNGDGIWIQKGTGSPGTLIHYNIFEGQLRMGIINTDPDENNQQFVQAQNNYWGCATGPVVAYKIFQGNNFAGWGYRDWLTKHDYGQNGDGDDPDENCALLYGADKLANFQLHSGDYSPYKINLGELLTPVCEDPDANNYGGPLPCDYAPAPTVSLSKSANPGELAEPGGDFTFTLSIHNTSAQSVTVTALTDDNPLPAGCSDLIGQTIQADGWLSCSYTVAHTEVGVYPNNAAVTVQDSLKRTASATANASVRVTDTAPTVDLSKTANPGELPEPGGSFTFTLTIQNTSSEDVTITALTDDNGLSPECQGLIGTSLAAGASVSCSYTVTHTEPGTYGNTATVTVADNDGQTGSDTAHADVSVTGVAPTVDLIKTADPAERPEPGGEFTFTLSIHNTSSEEVTISALTDDNPLSADCLALLGTSIAAGGTVSCTYTVTHTKPGTYGNTASVTVQDNDDQTASDTASASVTVTGIAPTVDLNKTANPGELPEPGGAFTFTLSIHNTSIEAVTITALTDENALSPECLALVGTSITAGGTVSCTYTVMHTEPGTYNNHASITVTDDDDQTGSDTADASVVVTDLLPTVELGKSANPTELPEPGGEFTFTLSIHNSSIEEVTITALADENALSAECLALVGTSIPAGETVFCHYSVTHMEAGTYGNHASVTVADNEQNSATDQAEASVVVTDVLPAVDLTKTADPAQLPEPGGIFTFTLSIHNSSIEPVVISVLSDSYPLSPECQALVGDSLPAGGTVACTYTVTHTEAGSYDNTATVVVVDNEGNPASDSASANVVVTGMAPTVNLTKTADPTSLAEPGGTFTFTLSIQNTSIEDVTITGLSDDNPLSLDCTRLVGSVIPAGETVSCTYPVSHTEAGTYDNTASVTVEDNDGETGSDTADARVVVTDVLPTVELLKTADPAELPEPGGVFTFTLSVHNTSAEAVTITALTDNNELSLECLGLIGDSIPAGGTVSCTYQVTHTEAGTYDNTASVTVKDNEGSSATAEDSQSVVITDVLPVVELTKGVSPATRVEPGGVFHFTLTITNHSVEDVIITALDDDVALPAGCTDLIGTNLIPGGSVSCSYDVTHTETGTYSNTASVTVMDNEEHTASDSDHATVTVTDVPPTVVFDKTATPGVLPVPGGIFHFTLTITNTSPEDVTITALSDDFSLPAACTSLIGTVLKPGQSVSCTYDVSHQFAGSYTNNASVTVEDNEQNTASDGDSATVKVVYESNPNPPSQSDGIIPVTGGETHAIAAGNAHTCAITPEGGVQCWGNNAFGQLGDGTNQGSNLRVDVLEVQGSTTIVAGGNHTCVLSGNDVWCWGQNSQGQLGDGTTASRNIPVKVLSGAADITAGLNYTCAVMLDQQVMCWGDNDQGQLADGGKKDQTRPTPATLISGITILDAGQTRSCGITPAGLLRCASPAINGLIPVTGGPSEPSLDVAVDRFGSIILALDENGVPIVIKADQSQKIASIQDAIDVDSGFGHVCALLSDGTVKCWGANSFGQLGNNSLIRDNEPQAVLNLFSAWQLAVGKNHTCVLIESSDPGTNDILCWGMNTDGQLGNGSNENSPVPVFVK